MTPTPGYQYALRNFFKKTVRIKPKIFLPSWVMGSRPKICKLIPCGGEGGGGRATEGNTSVPG